MKRIFYTIDIWRTYNKLYDKGFIRSKPTFVEIFNKAGDLNG